jgi:DNA-binding NtrC family response regulator
MKRGAADFVTKPWENERLLATLRSALNLHRSRAEAAELRQVNRGLAAATTTHGGGPGREIIGTSPSMLKVFSAIARAAPTDVNVMILGENGTGKELVAREIHRLSGRANEVFMRVDLGALSPSLFESELFGHRKGAFTDAKQDRVGYFRAATGGTLFLDEIGNVPLHLQAKLLTVLERREVVPVGAEKAEPINVRLISATNLMHERLHDENLFRPDLLYRINTVEIALPPLRERPQDVPLLLEHYAGIYSQKYNLPAKRFSAALMDRLVAYPWPGNVRALRHAVERAMILSEGAMLGEADFPFAEEAKEAADAGDGPSRLDQVEKDTIARALRRHNNNVSRAAQALGLTRTSLYRRMEKYGL